jgi:hypothetical protein
MARPERTTKPINDKASAPRGTVRQGVMQNTMVGTSGGPKPTVVQLMPPTKRGN